MLLLVILTRNRIVNNLITTRKKTLHTQRHFHIPDIMLNNINSGISDSEAMCPEYKAAACNIRKSKGMYKLKKEV
jgi:predicted molibdopterin-dependent oxidoreductase YjgC